MSEWTTSGLAKIKRAKEHFENLQTAYDGWMGRAGHRVAIERNAETKVCSVVFHEKEKPPAIHWATIAGDVIHNLRSSLDVLIWQLVTTSTGKPAGTHVKFPVSETLQEFEARDIRKIEGASEEAVRLIRALKPYKGGNEG